MIMKAALFLTFFSLLAGSIAQDAKTILQRSEDLFRGEANISEMTMTIVRPGWTREVSMRSWSLGDDYSLILVLSPARDKGIAYLKRFKEVWNWQPSIDRTIKLPPSMMSQSWMGSDFTNDDLVRENSILEDYTHQLTGQQTIEGHLCHAIVLTPKPDAAVVWGKVLVWIDTVNYWMIRAEYYDEEDYLVNTMTTGDFRMLGGRLLPGRMEMKPADKPGNSTIVTYNSIDFSPRLTEAFFTQQQMKQVRP